VVITVYADRSYTFITKTPPVAVLIKREAGIAKGSGEPNPQQVGKITMKQVEAIAKLKMPDLTADDLAAASRPFSGPPAAWVSRCRADGTASRVGGAPP